MSLGKLDSVFFCDFCGKNQHEVVQLIAGSVVHICDGCVEAAMGVILIRRHPEITEKGQKP